MIFKWRANNYILAICTLARCTVAIRIWLELRNPLTAITHLSQLQELIKCFRSQKPKEYHLLLPVPKTQFSRSLQELFIFKHLAHICCILYAQHASTNDLEKYPLSMSRYLRSVCAAIWVNCIFREIPNEI